MSPRRSEPPEGREPEADEAGEGRWEGGAAPEPEAPAFRRRAKPVPVRRRRWRDAAGALRGRGKLAAGLVLAAVGAGLLARLFFASGWFVLSGSDQIAVSGNRAVSTAAIRGQFGGDLGRNIFFIPLEQRRREITAMPWIREARVERLWPNRLAVSVQERTPVAQARVGSELELIDADGMLLPETDGANYDFPVLNGLSGVSGEVNNAASVLARQAQVARYLGLRDALDQGGAHHSSELSEVGLGDGHDIEVLATPPGQSLPLLIHLGDHDFAARYQLVLDHIAEWRAQNPSLPWVDLRYDQQGVVLPAPAPPAPAASGSKSGRGHR